MKPRFKILRKDGDHILLDSETRPGEISHSLEKSDGKWFCTCEARNEGGAQICKHEIWVRAQEQRLIREASAGFLECACGEINARNCPVHQ